MQNIRTHSFNEGPVTTGQVAIGYYVAFEPTRPDLHGRGETEWSAIVDLNKKIEAAGEDRDEDEDSEPRHHATQEQIWDRDRDYRKHEAA